MQIKGAQLNSERLNGNKLFLHTFKNFSTSSIKTSLKIHVIHALLSVLLLVTVLYIIVVVAIISNIINKKEGLASINETNVKSAKIEKEYNLAINNLNKDFALADGFVEAESDHFASRKDVAASFSFLYEKSQNN